MAGDGLTRPDGEGAAAQAAQVGEHLLGRLGAGEHRACLREEQAAGLGQLDTPPDPVEQLDGVPALQDGDGRADRRLDEVERLGGPGDVLALGHRHEDAQLVEGHGLPGSPRALANRSPITR